MDSVEEAATGLAVPERRGKPLEAARLIRPVAFAIVGMAHAVLIFTFAIGVDAAKETKAEIPTVLKMVDVEIRERERVPVAPPPEVTKLVPVQPKIAEETVVSETPVVESAEVAETVSVAREPDWDSYVPMHKISKIPVMPEAEIRARVRYPELALRAGIEGVVFLELYIDEAGTVRRVTLLKEDPKGKGFAEAAMKALEGMTCAPAEANGKSVAVKFRYPMRFSVK